MRRRGILLLFLGLLVLLACQVPELTLEAVLTPAAPTAWTTPVTSTPAALPEDTSGELVLESQAGAEQVVLLPTEILSAEVVPTSAPVLEQQPGASSEAGLYLPQPGTPLGTINFIHPELGCGWQGIGGQVFDENGLPVTFLVVEVGGSLNGQPVSGLALTGSAPQWGEGGYEFTLGSQPVASDGTVWVQFYDLDGTPVSNKIIIPTYAACEQAVTVLNLARAPVVLVPRIYLPVVY